MPTPRSWRSIWCAPTACRVSTSARTACAPTATRCGIWPGSPALPVFVGLALLAVLFAWRGAALPPRVAVRRAGAGADAGDLRRIARAALRVEPRLQPRRTALPHTSPRRALRRHFRLPPETPLDVLAERVRASGARIVRGDPMSGWRCGGLGATELRAAVGRARPPAAGGDGMSDREPADLSDRSRTPSERCRRRGRRGRWPGGGGAPGVHHLAVLRPQPDRRRARAWRRRCSCAPWRRPSTCASGAYSSRPT